MKPVKTLTVNGQTLSFANWSKLRKINVKLLRARDNRGWTPAQCVGIDPPPVQKKPYSEGGPRVWRPNILANWEPMQEIVKTVQVLDHDAMAAKANRIRRLAGRSLQEAADECGWTLSTQSNLESGKSKWTPQKLQRFNEVAKVWADEYSNPRTTAVNDGQSGAGTVDV